MTGLLAGKMQDWPLTVDRVIDHAATVHGAREVVTRQLDGSIRRTDYTTLRHRARCLSAAFLSLGIGPGDRVATLAWNSERHVECWYAAMGIGAVVHTLNPRLHTDQIAWIANDGGGRVLVLDVTFAPIIETLRERLRFEHYILIADISAMPSNSLGAHCYEALVERAGDPAVWGQFPETTAAGLCYTSGTTGNPKGVLYSHRSNVLHAMMAQHALRVFEDDVVMPVVPMFHANAWGLAFACPMAGAKLVMPGAQLDGRSLYELIDQERVTFAAAVPTVWLGLLEHLRAHGLKLPHLRKVMIGGAALPKAVMRAFEDEFGVEVCHVWGMTEMSPVGTIGGVPATQQDLEDDERLAIKLKQGRPPFGVELKLADEEGAAVAHDGASPGRLLVRGFAVVDSYFGAARGSALDHNGYFDTGDVATVNPAMVMRITDRAKDVIKSGGEWISSIDLENVMLSHPAVANAAAIGVPHPKWDERPLLVIELREGMSADTDALRAFLDGKVARWWMPDAFLFVERIPLGPTGKINKIAVRAMLDNQISEQTT